MICGEQFQLILSEVSFHGDFNDGIFKDQIKSLNQNVLDINTTDVSEVKKYKQIFVYSHYLDQFFQKFFNYLNDDTIIISHNSDDGVNLKYIKFLESKKIKKWFCQNKLIDHEKLISLPIGTANSQWEHGNQKTLQKIRNEKNVKDNLVFKNFSIGTNIEERSYCDKITLSNNMRMSPTTSNENYWRSISKSAYAISPHGNGVDCHRIWECLYLRTIPIVKYHTAFSQFLNLPILFVDDWKEVTIPFLREKLPDSMYKLNEKLNKDFRDIKELDINYWKDLLLS